MQWSVSHHQTNSCTSVSGQTIQSGSGNPPQRARGVSPCVVVPRRCDPCYLYIHGLVNLLSVWSGVKKRPQTPPPPRQTQCDSDPQLKCTICGSRCWLHPLQFLSQEGGGGDRLFTRRVFVSSRRCFDKAYSSIRLVFAGLRREAEGL